MEKKILFILVISILCINTIAQNHEEKRILKIGLAQMKVVDNEVDINLNNAEKQIAEAKKQGADIVILPECFDIGWANQNALAIAKASYGKVIKKLSKSAQENGIYVIAGVTEYTDGKLYNSALTFNKKGKIIDRHHKINILIGIEDMYEVGSSLNVFETPFGKFGVSICADNLKGSLSIPETLARMGAEIILSPSSWAVSPDFGKDRVYGNEWREPYTAISKKYSIPVVGVSNVGRITTGPWKDWIGIGNSIYTDTKGNAYNLPFGENAECLKVIELEIVSPVKKGTELTQ